MRVCDCCNEPAKDMVTFNRVMLTEDDSTKEGRQVANYPQGIDLCYGCYSVLYDKIQQAVAEATGNKQ